MPLAFKKNSYPDCTPESKELTKLRGTKETDRWLIKETGEEYDGPRMKLVTMPNGTKKAMTGFNMTRTINKTEEKQMTEEVIGDEKSYWIECTHMEDDIKKNGKAIAFRGYFAAKGLNALVGIIKPAAWNGNPILMMRTGKKFLSEMNKTTVSKTKGDLKAEPTEEDITALGL